MEQNIRIKEEKSAMKVSGFVVLYDYISKSKKNNILQGSLEIDRNTKNFDFRTKKNSSMGRYIICKEFPGITVS